MNVEEKIRAEKLVAIIRGIKPNDFLAIAQALYKGGVRLLEITLNTVDALEGIERISVEMRGKVTIGAGTVLSPDDVKAAVAAGAEFIISPNVDGETIKATRDMGVVSIPGAYTASEILQAYKLGGNIIKVFPANDPVYFGSFRGPFPQIPLMPTGGVTLDTIKAFKTAGAVAFGIGSALVDSREAVTEDYLSRLTNKASAFTKAIDG